MPGPVHIMAAEQQHEAVVVHAMAAEQLYGLSAA